MDTVQEKIRSIWGEGEPVAKYMDDDGDYCTLVKATFPDFLETARPPFDGAQSSRPVLKVKLFANSPPGLLAVVDEPTILCANNDQQSMDLSGGASSESEYELVNFDDLELHEEAPEADAKRRRTDEDQQETAAPMDMNCDDDEKEAMAMIEKTRQACEDELANHLRDWLDSKPSQIRYEAWIDAVHPENASKSSTRTVDSRMYLEASFHRRLWNDLACHGLEPEEREQRYVPSTEDLQRAAAEAPTGPAKSAEGGQDESTRSSASPSGPVGRAVLYLSGLLERQSVSSSKDAEQPVEAKQVQLEEQGALEALDDEDGRQVEAADDALEPILWKPEAATWLAAHLQEAQEMLRAHRASLPLGLGLPENLRPGLRLLGEVLRESGPEYETLASAALALASGSTLNGDGVAELLARAASHPEEGRLLCARAVMACCPQVLVPALPASMRAASTARACSGPSLKAKEQAAMVRSEVVASARQAAAVKAAEARCRAAEAKALALQSAAQAHRAALLMTSSNRR
eukprot:TRINITY_DN92385_c0_g1_i1.p1 TRINITY_DN92385_c0_g1~~TRINITY_DN92385_c0_g1_i1.p1  ORF type:complete len:584 (-),score=139.06 TRINITY_DN92385_c0_g1_i1:82-1638(-)